MNVSTRFDAAALRTKIVIHGTDPPLRPISLRIGDLTSAPPSMAWDSDGHPYAHLTPGLFGGFSAAGSLEHRSLHSSSAARLCARRSRKRRR